MPPNRGHHAMSLGLNLGPSNPGSLGAFVPPAPHKSAGRAFAFSLLLPGLGQLYCGKKARGWVTLGSWLLGLIFAFSSHEGLRGTGVIVVFVLWIFSFLDAYFTAIESNRGQDSENPRVAVTLNLLTAGFGYFYLGERVKGTVIFVATQVVRFGKPKLTGYAGGVVSLTLVVFQMLMGADAYRTARMKLKESLPSEPAPATGEASRLPAVIPIGLASTAAVFFIGFLIFGVALIAARGPRADSAARAQKQRVPAFGRSGSGKIEIHVAPASAVDLTSAVEQVQSLEKQTERRSEDIPELKHDVEIFDSALKNGKIDTADVAVAHYYRAEALRLINSIHEREGEALEPAAARGAIADFDNIISARANTYIPAVNVTNAEYLAGSVARNYLRSYSLAYRYWEKCALEGHPGCLHLMATARITGDGGQKVDINEALDLHTVVFNTGVRYRCAGAESALSIAEIGYFTGVRRPGDDELQWVNKSNALMDRMEAADGNKNVCHRAQAEVEEFLLQLSSGQRNENILQDAAARLGEESPTTKAAIQLLSGSASDTEFESAVQASKSESDRCSAYFDATWYAAITSQDAAAQRYHGRLKAVGKFHCGTELAFASKFKL